MNAGVRLQRQNILFDFKCVIKCVIIRVWSTRHELHTWTHEVQYIVCSVCVIWEFSCLGRLEACSSESVQDAQAGLVHHSLLWKQRTYWVLNINDPYTHGQQKNRALPSSRPWASHAPDGRVHVQSRVAVWRNRCVCVCVRARRYDRNIKKAVGQETYFCKYYKYDVQCFLKNLYQYGGGIAWIKRTYLPLFSFYISIQEKQVHRLFQLKYSIWEHLFYSIVRNHVLIL